MIIYLSSIDNRLNLLIISPKYYKFVDIFNKAKTKILVSYHLLTYRLNWKIEKDLLLEESTYF